MFGDPFSSSFSKENIDQQIFLIVANYSLPISFMYETYRHISLTYKICSKLAVESTDIVLNIEQNSCGLLLTHT